MLVCLTSKGNIEEDDGIGSLVISMTVSSSSHAGGKSNQVLCDSDARYLIMLLVIDLDA